MLKINIPTPCQEDWDKMTANQQGRHCNSCMKTVVDFTNMSDHEVKHFLFNKKEEHVCGRFSSQQLHRIQIELPANIFQLYMPWWKRFLVASLIVFSTTLFSCEIKNSATRDNGEVITIGALAIDEGTKYIPDTTIAVPVVNTTVVYPDVIMGDLAPIIDSTEIVYPMAIDPADTIPANRPDDFIKGEIEFIPDSIRNKKNECPSGVYL